MENTEVSYWQHTAKQMVCCRVGTGRLQCYQALGREPEGNYTHSHTQVVNATAAEIDTLLTDFVPATKEEFISTAFAQFQLDDHFRKIMNTHKQKSYESSHA